MGPIAKRTLFAIMVVILLLTACASAPAATQDPEFVQIEQTVDALAAAQNEPPVEQGAPVATPTPVASQQQSEDPAVAEQNAQDASTPDPASVALQQTIDALASEQNAQSTDLAQQAAQATGTAEQLAAEAASSLTPEQDQDLLFATPTQEPFPNCRITILRENSNPETFRFPPRQKLLDIGRGSGIIILQPVNLRTGPTLTHRILLTLRPDPSTTLIDSSDPDPAPMVTPRPEIIYKIIGGPAYTNIGDETGDNIRFSISGRKYRWWQIELPNKITGWIVEASACGQIPFIAKAN